MDILLANPRGFCAGVDRAISIVERALDIFEAPIYVRHEVVHNKYVVDGLKSRGAVFVEELNEVPDDSIVIFSAFSKRKNDHPTLPSKQRSATPQRRVFSMATTLTFLLSISSGFGNPNSDAEHLKHL